MTSAVPVIRQDGEGEQLWFAGGGLFTMKASSAETGGAFALFVDREVLGKPTPLHLHPDDDEVLYVLEGEIRVLLRDPKEDVHLTPGQTYAVRPGRAHLVTNPGPRSATFLVLQGIGEYDYVPLTGDAARAG